MSYTNLGSVVAALALVFVACSDDKMSSSSQNQTDLDAGVADAQSADGSSAELGGNQSDAAAQDTVSPDVTAIEEDPFSGEFQCAFTSESFAGSQSSGRDTSSIFVELNPIEGGFAIVGEGMSSPFASCEAVFDTEGENATLRSPQPCDDGFLRYTSGSVTATDTGFTANVTGEQPGLRVEMELECEPSERLASNNGSDLLGVWSCAGNSMSGGTEQMLAFDIENEESSDQKFRMLPRSNDFPFVLAVCNLVWRTTTATEAVIDDGSTCQIPGTMFHEASKLTLENEVLTGWIQTSGLDEEVSFQCSH